MLDIVKVICWAVLTGILVTTTNTLCLPVGGLLFIPEDPKDDTAEEAEEGVIVGGEGEEEKCAGISGDILLVCR